MGIIMGFTLLGDLLHTLIPLNIPTSIYGIILLFAALETGILKLEAIRETGDFLLGIMTLLFLPAVIGVLEVWDIVQSRLLQYVTVLIVTTVVVMAASALVTQLVVRRSGKEDGNE